MLYLKPRSSAKPACTEPARERLRLLGACADEGLFVLAPAARGGAGGSKLWGSAGPPLAHVQRGCTPRKETSGNSHLQRTPLKIRPKPKPLQLWRLHSAPATPTETFETPLPDAHAQAGPRRGYRFQREISKPSPPAVLPELSAQPLIAVFSFHVSVPSLWLLLECTVGTESPCRVEPQETWFLL